MYDYAFVHLVYTIPVALVLSILSLPILTRRDAYKITFLTSVAVIYTIPWDSYLIRTGIWTYPPHVVLGPTLLSIPIEELFFFVIQTYITSLLQIILNKPILPATYLVNDSDEADPGSRHLRRQQRIGQIFFAFNFIIPLTRLLSGETRNEGTYMRLIFVWASPVLLLLWSLSYQLLAALPRTQVVLPIALPTLYLWLVDTIALRRGTWSITTGTKMGYELWPGLEIEEALFFLVTNMLVVFGSTAFDNAMAIFDTFPAFFPESTVLPSPIQLIQASLIPTSSYDTGRLTGLSNALIILARKSRSFYLASGVFTGRLRTDLVLLYAFCRIADDLVDNSKSPEDAERWIDHLSHFLRVAYSPKRTKAQFEAALAPFSTESQAVMSILPVEKFPMPPLNSLLDGFRTDVAFLHSSCKPPIRTELDLEAYASRVASTIAELCLHLVYYHNEASSAANQLNVKAKCLEAGARMGLALQYVNIARDVTVDAEFNRCYIPADWFQTGLSRPDEFREELLQHRTRILDLAFGIYAENREEIELLPDYAKAGIRVAVESYMEIGRVLREKIERGEALDAGPKGKASVGKVRRLWVGWWAMSPRGRNWKPRVKVE